MGHPDITLGRFDSVTVRTPDGVIAISRLLPGITHVAVYDDPENNPVSIVEIRSGNE